VTYHVRIADEYKKSDRRLHCDLEPARGALIATFAGAFVWTLLLIAINWRG
jgi:hypothetical protein